MRDPAVLAAIRKIRRSQRNGYSGGDMGKFWASYRDILFICFIAVPVGVVIGAIDTGFGLVLLKITDIRTAHPACFLPFLGLAGAGMIYCYQRFGGSCRRGMPLIFEAGHGIGEDVPWKLVPFAVAGTWLTQLFGGSAGREGVAVQIGGTVGHCVGRRVPLENAGRILLLAGMAAGFSGLFQTPLAAVFFAMEVLTVGKLEHRAVLPILTASFTAYYTSHLLGLPRFLYPLGESAPFSLPLIGKLILLGVLFGVIGRLFSYCLHRSEELLDGLIQKPVRRIFITGTAVGLLSLLCWQGRYSGLGANIILSALDGGALPWDFALKFLFSVVSIAAGFQGGEVMPLFTVGAALGCALAPVLGLPAAFVAALGYAAVFGSGTNTLVAPILIGAEIFGFAHLPYFFVVCIIAYACNGDRSIYKLQKQAL